MFPLPLAYATSAPRPLMDTPAKINHEPTLPRYLRARPDSWSGVDVRRATSATYSIDAVVRKPAISSATTSVKNPPLRAPYGRLRMPAPMLAPKMIATPCQNVIDSKPSPFDALVCSDMVLLSRAPESARSVSIRTSPSDRSCRGLILVG